MLMPWEVPQKNRLKATILPDQLEVAFSRDLEYLGVPSRAVAKNVPIQYEKPSHIPTTRTLLAPGRDFDGAPNLCQWISRAYDLCVSMNRNLLKNGVTLEQGHITLLAFTFAPDEKPPFPWNSPPTRHQPSTGTAPYSPPRYFPWKFSFRRTLSISASLNTDVLPVASFSQNRTSSFVSSDKRLAE